MEGLLLLTMLFGASQQCGVAGEGHSWVPASPGMMFRGKNCLSGTMKAFSPLKNALCLSLPMAVWWVRAEHPVMWARCEQWGWCQGAEPVPCQLQGQSFG